MRKSVTAIGCGVLFVACVVDNTRPNTAPNVGVANAVDLQHQNNDNKGPTLVDIKNEPAGGNCPAGGTAIRTGRDSNFDCKTTRSARRVTPATVSPGRRP